MTYTGQYFEFLHPEKYTFDIEAIAHSLSLQCRWNGNCKAFFSTAEHSVMVSRHVPIQHALGALLHDGQESVMGDCPSPLKRVLSDFRKLEDNAEREMMKQFGVSFPLDWTVKHADLRVMAREILDLMPPCEPWAMLEGIEPVDESVLCLPPKEAKRQFLEQYYELTK